jgi:hypothetical protein
MHNYPMALYVTKHPASAIRSCITRLHFGIHIFQFLFNFQNFPLQNRILFGRNLPLFPLNITQTINPFNVLNCILNYCM